MPSDYRPANDLLNTNASLYIFHIIFHLDALPRERKGLSPVCLLHPGGKMGGSQTERIVSVWYSIESFVVC